MTFPEDIFTEPEPDPDTLANLGPLRPLAGTWTSAAGADSHPVADGTEGDAFVEHYELNPIDAQTNGPQLFYGLRYHTHITKPGEIETFHDQVGYWLWEPATGNLLFTLAIPRGQVALAGGTAAPGDTRLRVSASAGDPHFAILSNPFLDYGFHTVSFTMAVSVFHVAAQNGSTYFLPGNLVLSRSVYDNNPNNVTVGMTLPPNC